MRVLISLLTHHLHNGLTEHRAAFWLCRFTGKQDNIAAINEFTSLINKRCSLGEKIRFIQSLWQIAYADGELDPQEEYLVRKIVDLLSVPHTDFILAKLRVNPNP